MVWAGGAGPLPGSWAGCRGRGPAWSELSTATPPTGTGTETQEQTNWAESVLNKQTFTFFFFLLKVIVNTIRKIQAAAKVKGSFLVQSIKGFFVFFLVWRPKHQVLDRELLIILSEAAGIFRDVTSSKRFNRYHDEIQNTNRSSLLMQKRNCDRPVCGWKKNTVFVIVNQIKQFL